MGPGAASLAALLLAALVALLLQLKDQGPTAAELLLREGQSAASQQRWLDARGAFSLALEQLPVADEGGSAAHSRAQFLLGFTHARLGHHQSAADAYRSSLATAVSSQAISRRCL